MEHKWNTLQARAMGRVLQGVSWMVAGGGARRKIVGFHVCSLVQVYGLGKGCLAIGEDSCTAR